jgi:autotransporter-associated beta strand protein
MTFSAVDATNTISGTGTDLYFYLNQANTMILNPAVIGSSALVVGGGGTMSLRPQFVSNTCSGGTFLNGGTLNLQATASCIAVPGDLTISNATVTMSTVTGQIATTSNLMINGGGSFILANYSTGATQTLASVTFNNQGGTSNPTFAFGTPTVSPSIIILTAANAITATNDSLATTPVFTTGAATLTALQLSNAAPVITTSGLSPNSLNIGVPITSAGGALTKMGAGSLTLSAASTFTNGFNLNEGTLIIGVASIGTPPTITSGPVGTGTLAIAGGTTLLGATALTLGNATTVNGDFTFGGVTATNNLTLTGAMNLGAAARTITVSSPAVTAAINSLITTTATGTGLIKAGAGVLSIGTAQTDAAFGGVGTTAGVTVSGGILKNGVNQAIATSSLLTVNAGAGYELNGFDQTLKQIAGGGFITNSANSPKTLIVGGTSATDVTTNLNSSFSGVVTDNILAQTSSRTVLTKVGLGSLTLSGSSTYNGATTIVAGSIAAGIDNALPTNTALTIGTSATTAGVAATLALSGASQTVASLTTTTNVATASGNVTISSGETLTVTGAVTVGLNSGAATITKLNVTGAAGALSIGTLATPTNANVQIGNNSTDSFSNGATLDMSGLGTFYANLGTGTFKVGDPTNGTGIATLGSTVILAADSMITATTISADSQDNGVTEAIKLGSGTNRFNVTTLNVLSNGRASGTLTFSSGTGTLTIRGLAGGAAVPDNTSRATLNVANNSFSTGAGPIGSFDTTGHLADLRFEAMTIGSRSASTGTATGTFSFDTGTLDANDLTVGSKTSGSTATALISGTVNLAGGASFFNTATGQIQLGVNASTAVGTASGTLNVTGGTVTVAGNGGNSIRLGNASAAGGTATGVLSITGGTLTVAGDIIRGATTGTSNASLSLNGGTLDMGNAKIGGTVAGTNLSSLTFASGTLQNVAQINNGGALTKTTAGTLILTNTGILTNAYSGVWTVSAGILSVQSATGLGATTAGTSVTVGATLEINNAAVGAETVTLNGTGMGGNGALTGVGPASLAGSVALASATSIGVAAGADTLTLSGQVSGASALTKVGAGTLEFSGAAANTYGGATTISAGTIALNKTAGVNAIIGDGASSKATADIAISGGTLLWSANNQLADSVFINMASGTFNLNGKTETIYDFTNSGGSFSTGVGGSLTIADPTWSGGTNTINADSVATFGVLNISGGTNTVHGLEGTPAGTTAGGVPEYRHRRLELLRRCQSKPDDQFRRHQRRHGGPLRECRKHCHSRHRVDQQRRRRGASGRS